MIMKHSSHFLRTLFLSLALLAAALPSDARKPRAKYVIVISMDGFRHDYPDLYYTPNLDQMERNGIAADMIPSYPSSTFPNHYTIATGLVPDHNGLVNNTFWDEDLQKMYSIGGTVKEDPAFYLGEPLWNTAERQGVKAGITYWVSSEFGVGGRNPSYFLKYDDNLISFEERIDRTLSLMKLPKAERPRLLMIYFDEPDHAGHQYGPLDLRVADQVERVDRMVGRLRDGLKAAGLARKTDLIVLADHGMAEISPLRVVNPYKYIKEEWCERIIFGTPTAIFSKDAACRDSLYNALQAMEHVRVWKKEEIPAELNYGTSPRIGDIVIDPDLGWQISSRFPTNRGTHGFDPAYTDMHTVFRAEGPDFKKGIRIPAFRNTAIYPLVCRLLRIEPAPNDGRIEEVLPMLR